LWYTNSERADRDLEKTRGTINNVLAQKNQSAKSVILLKFLLEGAPENLPLEDLKNIFFNCFDYLTNVKLSNEIK
jgi:hypothetical protein